MRKAIGRICSISLVFVIIICMCACNDRDIDMSLWDNAIYGEDASVGEGRYTAYVEVAVGDRTVTFTVKTDKEVLGEALYELGIVNHPTFFDVCNGIKADWSKDGAYWLFYKDDTLLEYGIGDSRAATEGEPIYRLEYTK